VTKIHDFFSAPLYTYGNALINWKGSPTGDLTTYAHSYRNAARSLVAMHQKQVYGTIDEGALPILFLYRHAIELYLKAIVFKAAIVSINEAELSTALPKLWKEHSLVKLAEMARPVINARTGKPFAIMGDLEQKIVDLVGRIDKIDPGSYTFRYPVTSRGNSALPGLFMTNIFVFSEEVESVLSEMAEFCLHLEGKLLEVSDQIKLALHDLRS
jgi:hypothetical protein